MNEFIVAREYVRVSYDSHMICCACINHYYLNAVDTPVFKFYVTWAQ